MPGHERERGGVGSDRELMAGTHTQHDILHTCRKQPCEVTSMMAVGHSERVLEVTSCCTVCRNRPS